MSPYGQQLTRTDEHAKAENDPPLSKSAPPLRRPSTRDAYAKDVNRFVNVYGGSIPCGADDLIRYIGLLSARLAPTTILRRCMAIQEAHVSQGLVSPTTDVRVREAMRVLANRGASHERSATGGKASVASAGVAPSKNRNPSVKPITRQLLARAFDAMGTGRRTQDLRDKLVLLLGFSGLKRGEICGLNIEDLEFTADVMIVTIRKNGSNEENSVDRLPKRSARRISIAFARGPLCAAGAALQWLNHCDLLDKKGPLLTRFNRSSEPTSERLQAAYVNVILKKRLQDAGIRDVSKFTAESLCLGARAERDGRC